MTKESRITFLILLMLGTMGAFGAEVDYLANQYSSKTLIPPEYETFIPPPIGQTYQDPVFGTEIMTITDNHGVVGFNGERANFSPDDKYFFTGIKPKPGAASEVWLFNGRTGQFVKSIPIEQFDNARWSYDPETLVYVKGNQIRGYNIKTDQESVIVEFPEPLGDSRGRVCGGDGHDFDDNGEWILLNHGARCARMFAYNIRTGEKGPEMTFPREKADIDYATITPSGKYILVVFRRGPHMQKGGYGGLYLFDRQWNLVRQLSPSPGHVDMGYFNGTQECIVAKIGSAQAEWRDRWGLGVRDRYAVICSSGEVVKLLDRGTIYGQVSAVRGSNRRYAYWALETDNFDPAERWDKYKGEIVEIPLDGSLEVRRLLHHRCRLSEDVPHLFGDQPEMWINHAGDRLFFRSNMFMKEGTNGQRYGHDLFFVKIPPRQDAGN